MGCDEVVTGGVSFDGVGTEGVGRDGVGIDGVGCDGDVGTEAWAGMELVQRAWAGMD